MKGCKGRHGLGVTRSGGPQLQSAYGLLPLRPPAPRVVGVWNPDAVAYSDEATRRGKVIVAEQNLSCRPHQ